MRFVSLIFLLGTYVFRDHALEIMSCCRRNGVTRSKLGQRNKPRRPAQRLAHSPDRAQVLLERGNVEGDEPMARSAMQFIRVRDRDEMRMLPQTAFQRRVQGSRMIRQVHITEDVG